MGGDAVLVRPAVPPTPLPVVRSPAVRARPGVVGARIGAVAAIALIALAGILAGCAPAAAGACPPRTSEPCTRVLFLGNSYTYTNDLPGVFGRLAEAGGRRVETAMVAAGGETLAQHAVSAETATRLGSETWSFVVLQEQSEIPAADGSRTASMYPAARTLVETVRRHGAKPVLLMTWAHRDGWPAGGFADYPTMQRAIERAYVLLAFELGVPVAPVGDAWTNVRAASPDLALWQSDGSHPSAAGTYLAACVLYAVLFRESPAGLRYLGGLPEATARGLQAAASADVLDNVAGWNLG